MVPHPEYFSCTFFVTTVLKSQDRQQSVGLPGKDFVSPARFRRIQLRNVEADDAVVGFLHQSPRAPGVAGQQFPAVGARTAEMVRIIISSAPFDEIVVGRLRGHRIINGLRGQLRQVRETTGPAKRNLSAVWVGPVIVAAAEKIPSA